MSCWEKSCLMGGKWLRSDCGWSRRLDLDSQKQLLPTSLPCKAGQSCDCPLLNDAPGLTSLELPAASMQQMSAQAMPGNTSGDGVYFRRARRTRVLPPGFNDKAAAWPTAIGPHLLCVSLVCTLP